MRNYVGPVALGLLSEETLSGGWWMRMLVPEMETRRNRGGAYDSEVGAASGDDSEGYEEA